MNGVGIKLRIAHATKKHKSMDIDLVTMSVNNLVTARGGGSIFFLDYFATGKLDVEEAATVVQGITKGSRRARCSLFGNMRAEMLLMYTLGNYDHTGFIMVVVCRERVLPQDVAVGDFLPRLPISKIYSNMFSLVCQLVKKANLEYRSPCPNIGPSEISS